MGIFSGTNGTNALAREQREKTSEFLFTQPFTRLEIFWTKMLTVLTLLVLTVAIQILATVLGIYLLADGQAD